MASQQPSSSLPSNNQPQQQSISLVGTMGLQQHVNVPQQQLNAQHVSLSQQLNGQNVSILQSQLTPQQIAAFQSQTQQYANSPQAVAGIRPGTALLNVNVGNQNVAGLQNVQLLGGNHSTNSTLPINIITTGGQTFVQAASSNLANNHTGVPTLMQVRSIAPNAATVVNQQLDAYRNSGGASAMNVPQQLPPQLSQQGNKPVQQVNLTMPMQNAGSSSSSSSSSQVVTKRKLQDLLHEIDPRETIDDDVEEVLLQIADDFIENVISSSCQIAKNRKSNTLDVKDVQLHLDRNWNMWIPGYGSDDMRPYKKLPSTESHRQRLALIKKALKK